MRALILILVMALAMSGLAGDRPDRAWAADDVAPETSEAMPNSDAAPQDGLEDAGSAYCGALARQCGLTCQATVDPGSAAAAACEAQCAVERAACDARDTLSRLEPWLDDKTQMVDRFMEGFGVDRDGEAVDPDADPPTQQTCRFTHERCMDQCETRFDDDYAQAGCESVCALNRATCETAAGIETARPLIEREARRLQEFFDALRGREEAPPPPPRPGDTLESSGDGVLDI